MGVPSGIVLRPYNGLLPVNAVRREADGHFGFHAHHIQHHHHLIPVLRVQLLPVKQNAGAVGGKHDNVVVLAALKFHQTKIGLGPVDAVCTLCIGGGGAAGCSAAACVVAVVVWVLD